MSCKILRCEHRTSSDGKPEVFLQIEIETDDDVFTKSEWLSETDAKNVIEGTTSVETHVAKLEAKAIKMRPKILADEEHTKALRLETAKLEAIRAAADAEKAKADAEAIKLQTAKAVAASEVELEVARLETAKVNRDTEVYKRDAEKHKLDTTLALAEIEKVRQVK